MHLFPSIDLRDGRVVRLRQGDYAQQTTYAADPLDQARRFEQAGATWLHLVDLDGARSGQVEHLPVIERICRDTGLRVEVGGGVRDEAAVDQLLAAGVERVILGTAALRNWGWFRELAHKSGYRDRLVLGLDARQGMLAVAGWEQTTEMSAVAVAERVTDWPLAAIVYTDIATDGTLAGPNVDATRQVAEATRVGVVSSGGVGRVEHLQALRELPLQGVIVGRALYEDAFTIEQAIAAVQG
ncbi:MAG: 1-(5-phosphoribosyl)-5-[(5-phosphoribosylamino)methylideneamino]imidazole-4-carboxamide isomerase [Phycisphaeraceae bacterium]